MVGSSAPRSRHRSGAARRAQHQRAQARSIQHILAGLDSLAGHRGGCMSLLGQSLAYALRCTHGATTAPTPAPAPVSWKSPADEEVTDSSASSSVAVPTQVGLLAPNVPAPVEVIAPSRDLCVYLNPVLAVATRGQPAVGARGVSLMQVVITDMELVEDICHRVAGAISEPLDDLAFVRWVEGVGPGARLRDLRQTVRQAGIGDSIMVHPLRSFLVNRVLKAPRARWTAYSRARLGGVFDPSKHMTEELEDFFNSHPNEGG